MTTRAGAAGRRDGRGGSRAGAGRKPGPTPQTIENARKVQASREVTAAAVVERLARALSWDVRKLFDEHGQPIPIHQLDDDTAFLVQGVEYVTTNLDKGDGKLDRVAKIKVEPRSRYVEMSAKYLGLLVDRVKVEDDKPLREKVDQARKRLAAARKATKS